VFKKGSRSFFEKKEPKKLLTVGAAGASPSGFQAAMGG
jgi:hypothetical protein